MRQHSVKMRPRSADIGQTSANFRQSGRSQSKLVEQRAFFFVRASPETSGDIALRSTHLVRAFSSVWTGGEIDIALVNDRSGTSLTQVPSMHADRRLAKFERNLAKVVHSRRNRRANIGPFSFGRSWEHFARPRPNWGFCGRHWTRWGEDLQGVRRDFGQDRGECDRDSAASSPA